MSALRSGLVEEYRIGVVVEGHVMKRAVADLRWCLLLRQKIVKVLEELHLAGEGPDLRCRYLFLIASCGSEAVVLVAILPL